MEKEEDTLIKKSTSKITQTTDELLGQLKSGLSKIGDIGASQKNKFKNHVLEIFDVLPVIEDAGFKAVRVVVGVSVIPSVEVYFRRIKEIDQKHIDLIIKKHNTMTRLILKPLLLANDLQGKISTDDFIFSETAIEISIPPKVQIRYMHKDIAGLMKIENEIY